MTERAETLGEIDSPAGKLVYLYLETRGEATVEELKQALDLSQLKLYPILRTLSDRGLIEARDDVYRCEATVAAAPA